MPGTAFQAIYSLCTDSEVGSVMSVPMNSSVSHIISITAPRDTFTNRDPCPQTVLNNLEVRLAHQAHSCKLNGQMFGKIVAFKSTFKGQHEPLYKEKVASTSTAITNI